MPDQPLRPLDPLEEAVWRDLAKFFLIAPRLLDEDLQRGADISLSEYTTLMSLSEAPDHRLRITAARQPRVPVRQPDHAPRR